MEKEEWIKLLPTFLKEDNEVKIAVLKALFGELAFKSDIEDVIARSNRNFKNIKKRIDAIERQLHGSHGFLERKMGYCSNCMRLIDEPETDTCEKCGKKLIIKYSQPPTEADEKNREILQEQFYEFNKCPLCGATLESIHAAYCNNCQNKIRK